MTIKLFASDLDGTLLNSNRSVSARNKAAIKNVVDAGKIFVIATGRMYVGACRFAEELNLDIPMATYNGALVKTAISKKILYEHRIKIETAQKVLDYVKKRGYHLHYYTGDDVFTQKDDKYGLTYSEIIGVPVKAIGDDLFVAKEPPYKMLLAVEREELPSVFKEISEKFKDCLDVTTSSGIYIELMEPGINKWESIKAIAKGYGIKPEEIMCFGDSGNDITMVENAGIGVAVANAQEDVKKVARLITLSNDEDGVAVEIEKILAGM
ncbi:MAG: Cof-type HAD-IIB family hydrolase [Phascolarctobacterium sp.]|nr:Cof-type HAD-IIB family hydrolase [Phascolarctobacterium sp.]